MLSRLPTSLVEGKIVTDIGQVGTSLVVKYSDDTLQYLNLDELIAKISGNADFYFTMLNRQGVIELGKTVTDTIKVVPVNGFDQEVTFSAVDVPQGIFISFSPQETKTQTTITIQCGMRASVGQHTISITATDGSNLVRGFDLILVVANAGSGFGLNAIPTNPVNGQTARLNTNYVSQSGQDIPAGTTMMYLQHRGWQPLSRSQYNGNVGDWPTSTANKAEKFSTQHHSYTVVTKQTTKELRQASKSNRPKSNRKSRNR